MDVISLAITVMMMLVKHVEVHYMYMSTDHKCLEHELVLCYLC